MKNPLNFILQESEMINHRNHFTPTRKVAHTAYISSISSFFIIIFSLALPFLPFLFQNKVWSSNGQVRNSNNQVDIIKKYKNARIENVEDCEYYSDRIIPLEEMRTAIDFLVSGGHFLKEETSTCENMLKRKISRNVIRTYVVQNYEHKISMDYIRRPEFMLGGLIHEASKIRGSRYNISPSSPKDSYKNFYGANRYNYDIYLRQSK